MAGVLLLDSATDVVAASGSGIFNVRNYGATGHDKTLDRPAINQAIKACAAKVGGTVLLPAETYLSGSIHLMSNVHLQIDAGASILGAPQKMMGWRGRITNERETV
jgi:polygalacturonase